MTHEKILEKKIKTSKLTKRKVEYFEKTKNRRTISIQTSEWILWTA
jgi:hypothetical protein